MKEYKNLVLLICIWSAVSFVRTLFLTTNNNNMSWFDAVSLIVSTVFFATTLWLYFEASFEREWRDIAPKLIRQRCKIELLVDHVVTPEEMKDYLPKLSEVLGMTVLEVSAYEAVIDGVFVGYGGWCHWVTSGAHVYSYTAKKTQAENWSLFSVDAYTCKPFSLDEALVFTQKYFDVPDERIVCKEG